MPHKGRNRDMTSQEARETKYRMMDAKCILCIFYTSRTCKRYPIESITACDNWCGEFIDGALKGCDLKQDQNR